MRSILIYLCISAAGMGIVFGLINAEADLKFEKSASAQTRGAEGPDGPFCGLYCLYAAARYFNLPIHFGDILQPKYIGSSKGSSFAELKEAASDNRLEALPVTNISSADLRASRWPVILHTRSGADRFDFDHFVLFLGMENGSAKVFDPMQPSKLVPMYELMSRCDGLGLIVADQPIDAATFYAPDRLHFFVWASIVAILAATARWIQSRFSRRNGGLSWRIRFGIAQFAWMFMLAITVGVLLNFWSDEGLLARAETVHDVQREHILSFTKVLSLDDVKKSLASKDCVLIDARMPAGFKQGHLPGAINIPIGTPRHLRKQIMESFAFDIPLIVYCESEGCAYSNSVVAALSADGFANLSIYRGGWREWQSAAKN